MASREGISMDLSIARLYSCLERSVRQGVSGVDFNTTGSKIDCQCDESVVE